MAAHKIPRRLLDVGWCFLVPILAIGGYVITGLLILAAVGEPILATLLLGGGVIVLVGGARLLRPRWFAYAPQRPGRVARFLPLVIAGTALAFMAGQALAMWLYAMGGSAGFDASQQARNAVGPVMTLLLGLVVAPISEELLARGLIQPLLRKRVGIVAAILITTAAFALMHRNTVQFALTLPFGVVLGLGYERTRSVWPGVLIHVGFNLVTILVPAAFIHAFSQPVTVFLLTTAFVGVAWAFYSALVPSALEQTGER